MPLLNQFDVPIIGPWVGRVGHVIDIVATPCNPSPQMWVLAFWTAAPVLLYSLYKPDPVDYLTDRFGSGHKKGRKRRFRPEGKVTPDIPIKKGTMGWVSFTLTKLIERVGWYILVVDATTQFAVNWTSLAMQWSGCKPPGTPYARSNTDDLLKFPFAAGTHVFNHWNVVSQNGFFADQASIGTPEGFQSNIGLAMNFTPAPFPLQTAAITKVMIEDTTQDKLIWEGFPLDNGQGGFSLSTLVKDYLTQEPAHVYRVLIEKTEGWYHCTNAQFMGYGGSDRGLAPDP